MNILGVDTSSRACVLGVRKEQQTWTDEAIVDRSHSKEVLPRLESLLRHAGVEKSGLDLIVYGQGPGSFTGLRIGVGVVQGLAYGLDLPVVGVSSLACLAQGYLRNHGHEHAIVALEARHTEVYFGAYEAQAGVMQLVGKEGVFEASEIPEQNPNHQWIGVGSGWQLADELTAASGVSVSDIFLTEFPSAVDLLDLGEAEYQKGNSTAAANARPQYLREQVAEKPS